MRPDIKVWRSNYCPGVKWRLEEHGPYPAPRANSKMTLFKKLSTVAPVKYDHLPIDCSEVRTDCASSLTI